MPAPGAGPATGKGKSPTRGPVSVPGVVIFGTGVEIRTADGRYRSSDYEQVAFYPAAHITDKRYDWDQMNSHAVYMAGRARYVLTVGQRHTVVFADQVIAVIVLPADEDTTPDAS